MSRRPLKQRNSEVDQLANTDGFESKANALSIPYDPFHLDSEKKNVLRLGRFQLISNLPQHTPACH